MLRAPFSVLLSFLLLLPCLPVNAAPFQADTPKLSIVIVEGEGAINNIRQRVNREPIVQVEDENRKPVAGAAVVFFLPSQGPGGVFLDGGRSLTTITDAQGRAVMRGFRPNSFEGKFEIRVTASANGQVASAIIHQTAIAAGGGGGGLSTGAKWAIVIGVVAGAAAGGAFALTRGGGSSGPTPIAPTTLTPGTPTVGGPK